MNPSLFLGAQAFGVWGQALGAYMGARSQKQSLQFQADIAEINAKAYERSAQGELLAGQREEQKSRLATANLKGTQTARLAASGVDIGEGSAARTLASTDIFGDIDANTIAANAVRSAWGYRMQGTNARNDALMKRASAGAINPLLAAGTTALTGAAQVAGSWYSLNKAGAFDTPKIPPRDFG